MTEDYVEESRTSLQRRTIEPATEAKVERNPEREYRLKRTKICIVFTRDALMDKEQRLAERAQELQQEGYRGDTDKTREPKGRRPDARVDKTSPARGSKR